MISGHAELTTEYGLYYIFNVNSFNRTTTRIAVARFVSIFHGLFFFLIRFVPEFRSEQTTSPPPDPRSFAGRDIPEMPPEVRPPSAMIYIENIINHSYSPTNRLNGKNVHAQSPRSVRLLSEPILFRSVNVFFFLAPLEHFRNFIVNITMFTPTE